MTRQELEAEARKDKFKNEFYIDTLVRIWNLAIETAAQKAEIQQFLNGAGLIVEKSFSCTTIHNTSDGYEDCERKYSIYSNSIANLKIKE